MQIVFEDDSLIAVNKPPGLLVHPTDRRPDEDSLENLVRQRPGSRNAILLHRLDRDTSGVVLFARTRPAAAIMTRLFEEKRIRKAYLAVVAGEWPRTLQAFESRLIKRDDGGWASVALKETTGAAGALARTTFRRRAVAGGRTLLDVLPKTGRTHQIRLHCAAAGHPIVGDQLYNPDVRPDDPPQALHAFRLDFAHPLTGQPLRLSAPPPENWATTWLADFAAADILPLYPDV